jgi:hypothetical protein
MRVNAGRVHVQHDGDFETGLRLLELNIALLTPGLVTEQIVELLFLAFSNPRASSRETSL